MSTSSSERIIDSSSTAAMSARDDVMYFQMIKMFETLSLDDHDDSVSFCDTIRMHIHVNETRESVSSSSRDLS